MATDETTPLDKLARGSGRPGGSRWARWPVLLLLVWVALAALDLAVIAPFGAASRNASHEGASSGGGAPRHGSGAPVHRSHSRSASASPSPSQSASPSASPSRVGKLLSPVSISAFGPTGTGSGDDQPGATAAIDSSLTTGWQSQWYTSPEFGNLKNGTGLLVDMGRRVRVTSMRILLGTAGRADLEVLTGDTVTPAPQQVQASAVGASGVVKLTFALPQHARYLLIWFTRLPKVPNAVGHYQASVYNIRIRGIA